MRLVASTINLVSFFGEHFFCLGSWALNATLKMGLVLVFCMVFEFHMPVGICCSVSGGVGEKKANRGRLFLNISKAALRGRQRGIGEGASYLKLWYQYPWLAVYLNNVSLETILRLESTGPIMKRNQVFRAFFLCRGGLDVFAPRRQQSVYLLPSNNTSRLSPHRRVVGDIILRKLNLPYVSTAV